MATDIYSKCKSFCERSYRKAYKDYMKGKKDSTSNQAKARKFAIGKTALAAMKKYKDVAPESIWHILSKVHVKVFSNVELEPEVIEKILSARQSWVKSSGHAFEEMMKQECNVALEDESITVLLQRDLSSLLKKKKITNLAKDIDWLKEQCKSDVFDLYICTSDGDGTYHVFGCIQAKTSVRDRVTRDREPSIEAMDRKFWSVIFVFDAEFLHQDKFVKMVNGDGKSKKNGWHSAYSYDSTFNNDRIKYIGENLSTFVEEAKVAAEKFTGEERALRTSEYPRD